MKLNRFAPAAILAAGALTLSACGGSSATGEEGNGGGGGEGSNLSGTLTGIGASSQKAAMDAWIADFTSENSDAQVQYSPDGSGAGREQFLGGNAQFAGSDSYLDEDEVEAAKDVCGPDGAYEFPVYISPIAVAYNLEGVDEVKLSAETIAKIFKGEIKKWNDKAIAAENEGVELPDENISVVYRSDESGTSDNFQKFLKASTGGKWTDEGKAFPTATGSGANGSTGVADQVASTPGAITYVESGFAKEREELKMANIDFGAGPVELSKDSVNAALSGAKFKGEGHDLIVDSEALYSEKGEGQYPLVLTTYEIVCSKGYDENTAGLVKNFMFTMLDNQNEQLEEAGYIPVDGDFKTKLEEAVKALG